MPTCGLLILNKPAGMTSRQTVDRVARLAKPARTGHAGTLDPLATGVLVVAVGAATRLIGYVQRMPKQYIGTFLLGRQSATEDIEGEVIELPDSPTPTREEIVRAAERFVGRIDQRPPAFSAIKVAGRRAYDLARRGAQPQLAARPIEIHVIEVVGYEYPELTLKVACGSGTYIRSLGRDLAESLGTAAVMSRLVRTSIGRFTLEDALDPDSLDAENWRERLRPSLEAVECLDHVRLSADDAARIRNGLPIAWRKAEGDAPASFEAAGQAEIVAVDPEGRLVGILAPGSQGELRTVRNMPC